MEDSVIVILNSNTNGTFRCSVYGRAPEICKEITIKDALLAVFGVDLATNIH